MNNPVKKYFPPPVTWPGIMVIGALGGIILQYALPKAFLWLTAKVPNLQKGAASSSSTATGA